VDSFLTNNVLKILWRKIKRTIHKIQKCKPNIFKIMKIYSREKINGVKCYRFFGIEVFKKMRAGNSVNTYWFGIKMSTSKSSDDISITDKLSANDILRAIRGRANTDDTSDYVKLFNQRSRRGEIIRTIKTSVRMFIHHIKYDIKNTKHLGKEFPDKTFYVIRRQPPGAGLLDNFHRTLSHIMYANMKGYYPVVDMENYKTFYNEDKPINGTLNAWEYYFEQPSGYSLKDISAAKNIIFSVEKGYFSAGIYFPHPYFGEINTLMYNILVQRYCKFNQATTEYIKKRKDAFWGNKKNILGVLHRGSDMKTAVGCYTPATIEQIIQKTQQVFTDEKFDYIFLCTEEQNAVDRFRNVFKESLIVSDSQRIQEYNTGITPDIMKNQSASVYKNGLNYLADMYLLSLCDGIVASKVSGTIFTLGLNNNKYRYKYIFDLGRNA
jgi:hypothetical protein